MNQELIDFIHETLSHYNATPDEWEHFHSIAESEKHGPEVRSMYNKIAHMLQEACHIKDCYDVTACPEMHESCSLLLDFHTAFAWEISHELLRTFPRRECLETLGVLLSYSTAHSTLLFEIVFIICTCSSEAQLNLALSYAQQYRDSQHEKEQPK